MPIADNLATLRATLEDERLNLVRQLEDLGIEADGSIHGEFDEGRSDSGAVAAEQGEIRAIAATLSEQLADVERALAKMDEGGFGVCEECGNEIGGPRLEAMPATRFCIDHAG